MNHSIPIALLLTCLVFAGASLATGIYTWRRLRPLTAAGAMLLGALGLFTLAPIALLTAYKFCGDFSFFAGGLHFVIATFLLAAARRAQTRQADPEAGASTWSFREKSAGLVFGTLLVIVVAFLVRSVGAPGEAIGGLVIESIITLVLTMVAGHIAVALLHAPRGEVDVPADERDRELELRSTRNSTWVLGVGMWTVLIAALLPPANLLLAQMALGFIVLAELTWYGSLFAYYRLGADGAA